MKSTRHSRFLPLAALILCAASILTACGGGGGSGDDDNVPGECKNYCRFACAKVGNCRGLTSDEIEQCRSGCVDTILDDGLATANSCTNGLEAIAAATCSQIDQVFGFRGMADSTSCQPGSIRAFCDAREAGISLGLYAEER